jgi:GT2 family glycosyltransferase
MTSDEIPGVSLIIPTYGRDEVLVGVLPTYLSQEGVCEIVIVSDGPSDLSALVARAFPAPRVPIRVIEHPRNLGLCAARNTGLLAARGELVMMGEDDVEFCEGHVATLLAERERVGADLIAGIVYRLLGDESLAEAKARAAADTSPYLDLERLWIRLDAQLPETTEVPFTHALVLTTRAIALSVRYSPKMGGPTYFREDTEFSLAARSAGYRIFMCPGAECVHLPRHKTHGSGCRPDTSQTTNLLSTLTNAFQLIDGYQHVLRDWGYRGTATQQKVRLGGRAVWTTFNRHMEAESAVYRGALGGYRAARRLLRGAR